MTVSVEAGYRPNILLILTDDLNIYQGVYGGHPQAKTPHIDRLAGTSVIFDNAHSPAPVCAPARAAMFTGILPHLSGNFGFDRYWENPVLQNSKTLMTYLRENGYQAFGTGKLMHHNVERDWTVYGPRQYAGPVAYDGKNPVGHPSVPERYSRLGLLDGTFASLADVPVVPPSGDAPGYTGWWNHQDNRPFRYVNDSDRDLLRDEEIANWAVERIRLLEETREQPFFLAVGFSRPHTPLVAPQKYFDLYPLDTLELSPLKEGDAEDTHFFENVGMRHKGYRFYKALEESFPDVREGLLRYVQAYLACVSFVDDQIGKVITALEESGLQENTLVIFTSDHGYNLGEKEFLFKNSLWEESTQVPLLVRIPGNEANAGARVAAPVSLIDLYPTLADVCGLRGDTRKNEAGAPLSGHSMRPLLQDPSTEPEEFDAALTVVQSAGQEHYAIRTRDWRFIRYANGAEELYDHRNDPREWTNLARHPEYRTRLLALRERLFEQVPEWDGWRSGE